MRFKILAFFLLLCTGLFAADIGNFSSVPANSPSSFQRSSVTMQPTYSEGLVDSNYKLGPGDYLDIMLENNYLSAKVYPDGNVVIEECGSVNVAGKTIAEAREEILKLVSTRYNPIALSSLPS